MGPPLPLLAGSSKSYILRAESPFASPPLRPAADQPSSAGAQKLANHGDSLIAMINGYLAENNITFAGDFPQDEDRDAQVRAG